MLKDVWNSLLANWMPATVLFLLFFLAAGTFLQRKQLVALLLGLGRVAVLVVVSPLLFLRKLISELIDAGHQGEKEDIASDQFLMRRQLAALKAGVIVGSIAILAAGLVISWVQLPSRDDFRALRLEKTELESRRSALSLLAEVALQLDADWAALRGSALSKNFFKSERQLAALRRSRLEIEEGIPGKMGRLSLPRFLPFEASGYGSFEEISMAVFGRRIPLARGSFEFSFLEALDREMTLLRQLSQQEAGVRNALQAAWAENLKARDVHASAVAECERKIFEKGVSIKTRRLTAVASFFATIGLFYFATWFLGLTVEGAALAIRLVGDVHFLRDRLLDAELALPGRPVPAQGKRLAADWVGLDS